ncbi:MAG: hypothetical protein PHS86_04950 [Syntrophaceae bacterium]|nr:hypothetical protein [Syntrophaceae bacterium]
MTIRELVFLLDDRPWLLLFYFVGLPVVSWGIGFLHGPNKGSYAPWKYFYSILVYSACVPGTFAAVLTCYTIFFTRENLLDVSILIHVLPIVSMIVALALIRKRVSFEDIPGFDRLSGLITIIAVTFIIILVVYKTRIWVVFGGSILWLVVVAIVLFALLKWGANMLFGSPPETKLKKPY